jgi:integrase
MTPTRKRRSIGSKRIVGKDAETGKDVWSMSVEGHRKENGKRSRIYETFIGSEAEADMHLTIMHVNAAKTHPDTGKITVRAFFEGVYLEDMKELRDRDMLAPSTYRGYVSDVKVHIAPAPFGDIPLDALNVRIIKMHFQTIALPGAAQSAWKTFRQGINYAVDDCEILDTNPLPKRIKLPEKPEYEADVLTAEELVRLLDVFHGHRLEPWVLVSATTGLRRGESCALWWNDIDLATGVVRIDKSLQYVDGKVIERKRTKNKKSRPVAVPEVIRQRLTDIVENDERLKTMHQVLPLAPDRYNFKKRGNPELIASEYRRTCEKHGLHYVPPSNLRNTFATILDHGGANPIDIAKVLGHATLNMMHRHYIQGKEQIAKNMAEVLNAVLQAQRTQ